MKDRNELIYRIRQVIGDEEEDGFYTTVKTNNKVIKVPNYLFKDGSAQYPEIRISPFLTDKKVSHSIRIRSFESDKKVKYYKSIFQIDIYSDNIVEVNNIESAIRKRIDLFYDIDTVWYGYDNAFKLVDKDKLIYHSDIYNNKDFKIISVRFGNCRIKKVNDKTCLKQKNTYYIDETGLYINTEYSIKMIRINSILNGLVFPDGDTAHSKGIIKMRTMNRRMLSQLEENNVERVSFELSILYRMDSDRNPGPLATEMYIDSD